MQYELSRGSIETNSDGEVVGVSQEYIHLLGLDISDVVKRPEVQGIRKLAETHEQRRVSVVQAQQRRFRRYGKDVL